MTTFSTELFPISERGKDFYSRVKAFIDTHITPIEAEFWQQNHALNHGENGADWTTWQWPDAYYELREKAREEGLWNLFLPDDELGAGLSITDYPP